MQDRQDRSRRRATTGHAHPIVPAHSGISPVLDGATRHRRHRPARALAMLLLALLAPPALAQAPASRAEAALERIEQAQQSPAPVPTAPAISSNGHSCRQRDGDTSRPRIGLALGGGGARGVAHIGVLRKLEELGIPVDCIAGTSMGSLVGGMYAAGGSIDQLERIVTETDWKRLFDDSIERRDRSFRRKQDDRDGVATIGIGLGRGKLEVSPGVMQGERVLSMFQQETMAVATVRDFDQLPIPFRAIATDLNTGEAVELGSGSLPEAMRASMSLPGIFQPVEIDGRVLIDGGIADQVPIDTVRRMGADVVIAVDVGTPLMALGSNASVLQVVSQLTGMLTVGNTRRATEKLGPGDVLIVPPLGNEVATGDFDKAVDALRIGDEAAQAANGKLAAMPRWRDGAPARPAPVDKPVIEFVRLENESPYADEVITGMLEVPLGQPLDPQRMEASILRVYSEDTFASVSYQVVEEEGRTGVVVHAREKPQGPNYLQAGLRLQTDFNGNYESSLQLALLRAPVTPYGAEARILLGLGSEPGLQGEYYHPFDPMWRWYFYGRAGIQGSDMPLFNLRGDRVATYEGSVAGMALSLGRTFGRYGAAELGLERTDGTAEVLVGDPDLPDLDLGAGTWFTWAQVDRLDSLYFPREGYSARVMYRATTGWLGGDADFEEVGLDVLGAIPFGRHAVQAALAYHATIDGVLPLSERHRMGGRGRLVGYHYNELTGQNYALVMLGYSYQLASIFSRSAVVGTTLEYGNAWELRRQMDWSDGVFNGSVYVGFDSWIGPMQFGYGLREGGDGVLFLEIGRPF